MFAGYRWMSQHVVKEKENDHQRDELQGVTFIGSFVWVGLFIPNEIYGFLWTFEATHTPLYVNSGRGWILKSELDTTLVQQLLALPEGIPFRQGPPGEIRKDHDLFPIPLNFSFHL